VRLWPAVLFVAACGGTAKPPLPTWDKSLPEAEVMGSWRGLVPARGIIHLHSPYSHDACDNMPRDAQGVPNEPCLQDLREALCVDHIDFAALTDHGTSMADEEFPTLFSMRGSDEAILDDTGAQIASRMTCDDGHQVTITVGGENELMPVMLHRHVPGDASQRHATYGAADAAAVQAMHDAGGLVWFAHTEQHDIAQERDLQPDGIEVYNLHANIDPKIRGPYLGLDPDAAIVAAVQFADTNEGHPEPDLALLSFMEPNQPAIDRWNQALADGRHLPATAGSDAHENALPIMLADGERGDSYRRVLRWFSNVVLVNDPQDPAQIEAALAKGRLFAVFELLGTPEGLDIHAGAGELGDTVPVGTTLEVKIPHVRDLDRSLPPPTIVATVYRIDATGPAMIAQGSDDLTIPMASAGAYRVEISMIPHHLGPYLGDLGPGYAEQTVPWIYASPIYAQ
jgi:hypothetical protein